RVMIVVRTGSDVKRSAGPYIDDSAQLDVPRKLVRSREVQLVAPIEIGQPAFPAQIIVVGRKREEPSRVVGRPRKGVLPDIIEVFPRAASEHGAQAVAPGRSRRLKLVHVDETRVRPKPILQRRIFISRAIELHSSYGRVFEREEIRTFSQLSIDGNASLDDIRVADIVSNAYDAGRRQSRVRFGLKRIGISRIGNDHLSRMGCDAEYSGCSRFTFWKSLGVVRSETRFRGLARSRRWHSTVPRTSAGSPADILAFRERSWRAFLPSVPIVELISGWNLACDVHDDGLPLPALDQLLLAEISPQELFDKLHAAVFDNLRVGFQATVEGHRDFPWARKDLRILDRHLVMYGVTRNRREAFNQM